MRQRFGLLSGWIVAAVVVGVGLAGPNEIRTRRVVIEDGNGTGRMVLAVEKGKPVLSLLDAQGRGRVQIGLNGPHDEGYCSLYKHRDMKERRELP